VENVGKKKGGRGNVSDGVEEERKREEIRQSEQEQAAILFAARHPRADKLLDVSEDNASHSTGRIHPSR
jgi:hypothetical protein